MALWPANRRDGLGFNPYRYTGQPTALRYVPLSGSRFNPNTVKTWSKRSAIPQGYSAGGAYTLPLIAGGISGKGRISFFGAAALTNAMTLAGNGVMSFAASPAPLGLVVRLSGTGSMSFASTGRLSLTIGLSGGGSFGVSGTARLSMLVPFSGSAVMRLTGAANLKGTLRLSGSWGGATPLSPEGLAQAVWNGAASGFNQPGTMGEKLNASGAGGNPWSVTLEGTYTAADLLRLIASMAASDAEGLEGANPVFKSLDGTKDRIVATQTGGDRTIISRDPS